jgi:peroxiredoxin
VTIEKQVTDRGFQIIAISPDTPSELNKCAFRSKAFRFPLESDQVSG